MKKKSVTVVPYDHQWPQDFDAIRRELTQALGTLALDIQHVGSTSVPGLAAKPIIDIDVVIADQADFSQVISKLAEAGYCHEGDLGIPKREAFCYEGKQHLRKHHLYVCPESSAELHRHITFRDYLRAHPEAVAQYGAVKLEAADLYSWDIDGYMEHKAGCIAQLYAKCGLE